ncbi:MAG: hypothetical protein RR009_04810 [Oscillospiraceae bacterium]
MRLTTLSIVFLLVFSIFLAPCASAESAAVSSSELIEKAKDYDGKNVTFCGEAVGDILPRGEYAWVCVCDANNSAMGVYVCAPLTEQIAHLGEYGEVGDSIKVIGVFNRACAEHGGDMDIHATSVEVTAVGGAKPIPFSTGLAISAVISFAVASALIIVVIRKHR